MRFTMLPTILEAIRSAEKTFIKKNNLVPDAIIMSPVGHAIFLEELGRDPLMEDVTYEGMHIAICDEIDFPDFKMAFIGNR